jgi:hypothetical protein
MLVRLTLVTALLVLAISPAALAQGTLTEAADALRDSPVYVDPDAQNGLSESEVRDVRGQIFRQRAGPLYIAVLPEDAADEAGGDPDTALGELALSVGEPGTYAAVIGDSFPAAASDGILPEGTAPSLAEQASEAQRGAGVAALLEDFVGRVGEARASARSSGDGSADGSGGGFPFLLVLLLVVPLALFAWSRRRRRRQEQEDLEQVKAVARDDLVALGDDILALDLDIEMPGIDEEARRHYALAVERYEQAEQAWGSARRPQEMERVTALLEEGRWAMTAAKARLEGQPVPERRPPCFFDPRHGPSVGDVDWAPPGGGSRPVPVCAADATRIADGEEPDVRQVEVNGRSVPYWQAGPAFGPWAGGFYGGGLLPGLFIGSALGGGFGAPGDASAADADAGAGDAGGGDFGGGGFGGGDFGGGGFGGGDFGGGGF